MHKHFGGFDESQRTRMYVKQYVGNASDPQIIIAEGVINWLVDAWICLTDISNLWRCLIGSRFQQGYSTGAVRASDGSQIANVLLQNGRQIEVSNELNTANNFCIILFGSSP